MNTWIVKNIKFGYKYTTSKYTRKAIHKYFDEYLINLLKTKGNSNDKFIIAGGLFHNTNPSLIAISDANEYVKKISDIMNVVILTTKNDTRYFDGSYYSTNDLISNSEVEVIPYSEDGISFDNYTINQNESIILVNNSHINIPNIIQFEENDDEDVGIFIHRSVDNKTMVLRNKYSPKHISYEVNTFEDLKNIDNSNNFIHLIINEDLENENKQLLDLEIFRIKPASVKNIVKKKQSSKILNDYDIINTIYNSINDVEVRKHFDKVLEINKLKKT